MAGGGVREKLVAGRSVFPRARACNAGSQPKARGCTPCWRRGAVISNQQLTNQWLGEGVGMDVFAEQRLVAMFPDAGASPVVLRVGRPYAHSEGDHACLVQADGLRLWQGPTDICGVGTWHTLMLGLRFLRQMLAAEADRGAVFHSEGGEHPISIEELFALHAIE
jgi:hypothetical protein